jgi:capsule polysaccharide export protein KpsE/RkpR
MENNENLLGVISTLLRWRKPIIRICLIAGIGTALITWFGLDDYYQSTTVFYAASPDLGKPEAVGEIERDRDIYGEDTDNDRLLTIAQSKEFKLYDHYEIDPSKRKSKDKVRKKFRKLYTVEKTKYEAIEIAVEDRDSIKAAEIVNAARIRTTEIAQALIKNGHSKRMNSLQSTIKEKQQSLYILGDSLSKVRKKYQVFNTETQGELLAQMVAKQRGQLIGTKAKLEVLRSSGSVAKDSVIFLKAQVKGFEEEVESYEKDLALFNSGMSLVNELEDEHQEAREQISIDRERFKQLKASYDSYIPTIMVVENGTVPVVKSRPGRALITISAVIIAFILSLIGVLILENYKDVDWKKLSE